MPSKAQQLITNWFDEGETTVDTVTVLNEKENGRDAVFDRLVTVVTDHVIGLKVIESLGGFPKATHVLRNRTPENNIARSGFLGEILATEYVEERTEFSVPVRRLRHRDTRNLAMRGDDVLGFQVVKQKVKVMKVEAKSRATLSTATITEAREGLANHDGRPNPETLAFLDCHLRLENRDVEAEPISKLQKQPIRVSEMCHLIFTLSGNVPTRFLENNCDPVRKGIELQLCGCCVKEHSALVKSVFDACLTRGK